MKQRILIIDDDTSLIEALMGLLAHAGYEVRSAETAEAALDVVRREPIELVLLDIRLGAVSGLDLLPQLRTLRPEMSVIVVTGMGTIETAVETMRLGADNFLVKPVDPPRLLAVVAKGFESRRLRHKSIKFERLTQPPHSIVLGESGAMNEAMRLAETVAARDTTVLLRGETGTGKGLLARLIHNASPRKKEPFVALNCAGLQRELTESELFGHERGAFTGAVERKIGFFEAADGGTLFLDEIGEMDVAVQAKLLNVLEQKRFRRVGGVTEIEADVRLIAATNRNLAKDVEAGRFREDLYYRLNVFTIDLPPLRERREDIVLLAAHFLREFRGAQSPGVSSAAAEVLLSYGWPGNVRELRNVIERAAILCPPDSEILPEHLPALSTLPTIAAESESAAGASVTSAPMTLEEVERHFLETVVKSHRGNLQAVARALGISRSTLYRKLKKYSLSVEE